MIDLKCQKAWSSWKEKLIAQIKSLLFLLKPALRALQPGLGAASFEAFMERRKYGKKGRKADRGRRGEDDYTESDASDD